MLLAGIITGPLDALTRDTIFIVWLEHHRYPCGVLLEPISNPSPDSLSAKLDLNLRDCGLLIKTGVLGEATLPSALAHSSAKPKATTNSKMRELLACLQIGHLDAKHRTLDSLVKVIKKMRRLLSVLGLRNILALVQLITATSPRSREKTVTIICSLPKSGSCEILLVFEGMLPSLIKLVESGSVVGKEKAMIS
ncbi:hypothetical protein NE237_009918 [Protea cynaroides]|uniref:Uncharacterized protein n=1 Tax=Protea cynaroides TaxID=273540 RepID=A0A9Q0R0R3_9MAGN|nr:hypothetical protein NE237_009918 [Protea cynaroides]